MVTTLSMLNGFDVPVGGGVDNAPYANDALVPSTITFAIAAGTANVALVTATVRDGHGVAMIRPTVIPVWLSDAATGIGLTATTASGAVTAAASGGTDFGASTAKKALTAQTKADGTFVLSITDTAKTGFYVCAQNPVTGQVFVSAQLVTASYGA